MSHIPRRRGSSVTGTAMCAIGVLIASGGVQLYVAVMLTDAPGSVCTVLDPVSTLVVLGIPIGTVVAPLFYVGRRLRGSPLGWRWHLAFPLAVLAAVAQPSPDPPPRRAVRIDSPSIGRGMRDLAAAQEAAYDSLGRYARELAELRPVMLPRETVVSAIVASAATYEIRIDSGVPVARSCTFRGDRTNRDRIGVFFVDCR